MTWIPECFSQIAHIAKRGIFFSLFYLISFNSLSNMLDPLNDNEGYLVVATNIDGFIPRHFTLSGESIFQGSYLMDELTFGDNIRIIKMKAGTYHWSKLKINNTYSFKLEEDKYTLKVEAGKVNYSGHLIVNVYPQYGTANFRFVNRVSQVFDEIENCCDSLLENTPLIFNGTGADPFVDYFSRLKIKEGNKNESN